MARDAKTTRGVRSQFRKAYQSAIKTRRILDRMPNVRQYLQLDGEYKKAYDEFIKRYNAETADLTKDERLKSGRRVNLAGEGEPQRLVNVSTVEKVVQGKASFRAIRRFHNKLLPGMADQYDYGHINSAFSLSIAQALAEDKKDPFLTPEQRKKLLVVYRASKRIDDIDRLPDGFDKNSYIRDLEAIAQQGPDIVTDWEHDVTVFDAKGKMSVSIGYEDKTLNRLYKGLMAAELGRIAKDIFEGSGGAFDKVLGNVDWTQIQGSPTIEENIEQAYATFLATKKAKTNFRKKKPKKVKQGKQVDSGKAAPKKQPASRRAKRATGLEQKLRNQKVKSTAQFTLTQLLPILNERINDVVLKNMGAPRLENRTGRFAGSVRITDVNRTAQGFESVGYTYQKSPYQTFEVGGRQGSDDLDPRRLIDASIREIAASYAVGRFYTRRV